MKIPPSTIKRELRIVGKVVYGVYVGSVGMFSLIRKEHGGGMRMLASCSVGTILGSLIK
jgi:hypothetical protein